MVPELQTHFLSLYAMALSDTEFHEKELTLLYQLGEEKGIPKEKIDSLLLDPSTVPISYPETIVEKIEYLYDYARIILADGLVEKREIDTLEKFCLKFQFEEHHIPVISEMLIEAVRSGVPKEEVLKFVTQNN